MSDFDGTRPDAWKDPGAIEAAAANVEQGPGNDASTESGSSGYRQVTAEIPIEEIIGWTENGHWWIDEPEGTAEVPCWVRPDGIHVAHPPSVDDLADWLNSQHQSFAVCPWPGGYRLICDSVRHDGRTMHDTFEAAVRHVSGLRAVTTQGEHDE